MSLLDLLLRDNAALRDAEKQLRRQEDHVFRLVDGEDRDLGTHVRADIPAFRGAECAPASGTGAR